MNDITVCIITRDQEEELRQCLLALKKLSWKILVVDTGSVDGSRKIAEALADAVYDFDWIDDFAAAKNFAASKAQTRYVLTVDTDEFLTEYDFKKLLISDEFKEGIGCIKRLNRFIIKGEKRTYIEWVPRLYDRNKYHYEGSIHEQLVSMAGNKVNLYRLPLVFFHGGYNLDGEDRIKKARRNINLLEKELEEKKLGIQDTDILTMDKSKQNEIAYLYYQLGKSYYFLEEYVHSAEFFEKALGFDLDERLDYVRDMIDTFGYALINSGQIDKASGLLNIYDTFSDRADFCFMIGLLKMQMTLFDEAVDEFVKAAGFDDCSIEGTNSYLAYYNAGVIRQVQGNMDEAKGYYEKCGDYEPARLRLREI